jgi:hypothetical protein
MFGPKHYVPILKWKPAEQKALQELSAEEKKWITPLIQPVMPQPKAPKKGQQMKSREEQLEEVITDFKTKGSKIAEEIITAWGTLPIFVDLSLVYTPSLRVEVLTQILALGNEHGAFLIPVINLSSDAALIKSVSDLSKQHKHGLCLRLVRADLSDTEKLSQQIKDLLVTNGLSTENTDLLLDLNVTDEHDHEYHNLLNASQMIPHLTEWRTLTIACGAFPEDLTKCVLGENYIPRSDWKNWLEALQSIQLIRIPSFADYTIQHPIHKESSQFFSSKCQHPIHPERQLVGYARSKR